MINLITDLISFTQSTNLDRESLSVIESIAKIKKVVNECITQFNNLEEKTEEDYKNFLNQITNYKNEVIKIINDIKNDNNSFKNEFREIIKSLENFNVSLEIINKQSEYVQELAKINQDKIDKGTIATQDEIKKINTTLNTKSDKNLTIPSINLLSLGADNTGTNEFTEILKNALTLAQKNNTKHIYIPEGEYYYKAISNSTIQMLSGYTLEGEGDSTVIYFDDNPELEKTWSGCFITATNKSFITLKNLKIKGNLEKYGEEHGQSNALPMINFNNCNDITFNNVTFEGSRTVTMQIANCRRVKFTGCKVLNSLRDGMRCIHCKDVIIDNNYFFNVADDCITVSSVNNEESVNSNTIITNNHIVMSQGVKALGGKNVIIADNTFKLTHGTSISVCYLENGEEGRDIPMNLIIHHNIIQDNFRLSDYGEGAVIVDIQGSKNNLSFNDIPYNYYWEKSPSKQPPFNNIIIDRNIVTRTLPNTDNFTSYGYGKLLIRSGSTPNINPPINDSNFNLYCFQFVNGISNMLFDGNIISGYNTFNSVMFSSTLSGLSFSNIKISNNNFNDIYALAIRFTNGKKSNVTIENNTFDLDPYYRNSAHNHDNTWDSEKTGSVSNCIGGNIRDVIIKNNTFKNCYMPFGSIPKINNGNIVYMQTIEGGNKGVSMPMGCDVIEIDGNPTSENYMQVI